MELLVSLEIGLCSTIEMGDMERFYLDHCCGSEGAPTIGSLFESRVAIYTEIC